LSVILFIGAASVLALASIANLVKELDPAELESLHGGSIGSLYDQALQYSTISTTNMLIMGGVGLVGILLLVVAMLSRYWRTRQASKAAPTAWDRDRLAQQAPAYRFALWCLGLTVAFSLIPLALVSLTPRHSMLSLGWAGAIAVVQVVGQVLALIAGALGVFGLIMAGSHRGKNAPTRAQLITAELMEVFGPSVRFEPDGHLHNNPLATDLLKPAHHQAHSDRITGVWKGVPFEQADVRALEIQRVYDRDLDRTVERFVPYFVGRWIVVTSPKPIAGKVLILTRKAYADQRRRLSKLGTFQEVELEDAAFSEHFVVLAQSPHEAFFALTPPLIERFKAMAEIESDRGSDVVMYIAFMGGVLHIGLPLVDAFAGVIDDTDSEAEARRRVRTDIQVIVDVVDAVTTPSPV
jgi:hypothetical protein